MIRFLPPMRRTAGLLLALALVTTPAAAAEYTESHIAAAREAITASGASAQFDVILPTLADQAKTLFQRSNPSLVQEIDDVVNTVALDLAKRRPELERQIEKSWASRFTEAELKEIVAFYKSAIGIKLVQTMPFVLQETVRDAQVWRDGLSTEIVTKSRDELIKRGHQF